MRQIIVASYNPAWPHEFAKIENEIMPHIRDLVITIEHVGSTAVPGLPAKPVIDMNIIIQSNDILPNVVQKLAQTGYNHIGDLGIADREAFRYENKPHLMAHHLYVCPKTSAEHKKQVAFRDYLRQNPEERQRYGEIKTEMAKKFPRDIDSYIKGKEPVILDIYKKCGLT